MGGSKDKMEEWKCPKEFLKDAMQMKIKLEWDAKCSYAKHVWEWYNPTIRLYDLSYM